MASSYYVAWLISQDQDLTMRIAASAQQESSAAPIENVEQWARDHRWEWSTKTDWIASVAAAMETGIADWGKNPGVIPDQYILSYVQGAING